MRQGVGSLCHMQTMYTSVSSKTNSKFTKSNLFILQSSRDFSRNRLCKMAQSTILLMRISLVFFIILAIVILITFSVLVVKIYGFNVDQLYSRWPKNQANTERFFK
jgi:hypothetical protein